MKLLVISDIHGCFPNLQKILNIFENENFDELLILGDVLYHGPRNPLPEGYDTKKCYELLLKYKDKIHIVQGNCDSEVDEFVLETKFVKEYRYNNIFATHGHHFDPYSYIPKDNEVFLFGHYHIPMLEKVGNGYVINPGSLGLPKNNLLPSYLEMEYNKFAIKFIDGTIFKEVL
jgi:putative phosphoesterase